MSGRFDFSSAESLNGDQRIWLGSVLDNQTRKTITPAKISTA